MKGIISDIAILFSLIFLFSCSEKEVGPCYSCNDLIEIESKGKLVAYTDNNSTNYFIYKGMPMGFQYELLKEYTQHLGVDLELKTSNNLAEKFHALFSKDCDIIAANLTETADRYLYFDFTHPHSVSHEVLIQRKPEGWRSIKKSVLDTLLLSELDDLDGKIIFVQRNSSYSERLHQIEVEEAVDIKIVDTSDFTTEQLIEMVADGTIDYTVCDENVALVNQTYFSDIDVSMILSKPKNLCWIVRKGSDSLANNINVWLKDFKKTKKYRNIYDKYFRNPKSRKIFKSDYNSIKGGKISEYDDIIKEKSKMIGWDWRLVASIIYHESRFDNSVRSWAGAMGLMQIMPETGANYGIDSLASPGQNITAGMEFIKWLYKYTATDVTDKNEQIKFILAAYTIGPGHVEDARRLAKKNGANPNIWDNNVEKYMLLKSNPKYYNDKVVKYGYCKGWIICRFVSEVLEVFEHYKNAIPD